MRTVVKLFLSLFYSKIRGTDPLAILGTVFFTQKIIGFNRMVSWPVHRTSRVLYRKNIALGNRTFPGWSQGCYIQARNGIKIGHNLRMGPNVGLISSNHDTNDYDKWVSTKPIIIGDNVWIGMNAVVLPGVTIGDNVLVAANSVVIADVPPNTIVAGAPCKPIGNKSAYTGKDYGTL